MGNERLLLGHERLLLGIIGVFGFFGFSFLLLGGFSDSVGPGARRGFRKYLKVGYFSEFGAFPWNDKENPQTKEHFS